MILGANRHLAGRADDYNDPPGAIGYQLVMLLREYAEKGGDLECVQLTVGLKSLSEKRPTRQGLFVQLRGYETSPGSGSATTASSATP